MNNRRLQFVLQETLQAMRRRGLAAAQDLLHRSTRGYDLPGPHDKEMVQDVLKGLDRGSDNALYMALDVMSKRLCDEPRPSPYKFVRTKERPYTDAGLEACLNLAANLTTAYGGCDVVGLNVSITEGTEPMNTEQLRAALAESEAADAAKAAAEARDAHLQSLSVLAGETQKLVNAIRSPGNSPIAFTRAKELKALAEELGARIVPTNTAGLFIVLVRG